VKDCGTFDLKRKAVVERIEEIFSVELRMNFRNSFYSSVKL